MPIHTMNLPESQALEILTSLLHHYGEKNKVAIDTETNGREIRDGRGYCVGVSLAWEGENALYLPFRHIDEENNYDLARFLPVLQQILGRYVIVFHNAAFDLISLRTLGCDTEQVKFMDTMLLAHLLDEELLSYKLDYLGQLYLGMGKLRTKDFVNYINSYGWGELVVEMMYDYATFDAYLTYNLYKYLAPKLRAEKLERVWAEKCKFVRLIMGMEQRGIKIDTELAKQKIVEGEAALLETSVKLGGFNPASVKDNERLFIHRLGLPVITKKRKDKEEATISFDKTTMEEYDKILELRDDETAKLALTYRGWSKSVSSNYRPYLNLLSPDGRLRPGYKLHGTKTGRMSCANPNLQQVPRSGNKPWNGMMKKCFIPDDGFTLMEFDYSQLELRIGAAYAEEKSLLKVFEEGRDVFDEMAEALNMERYAAKTLNYSIAYGAGLDRISAVFKVSRDRAAEIRDNYFDTYPGFKRASDYAQQLAKRNKRIKLWTGRYRHFNHPAQQHKAFNALIQGGAADFVEYIMLELDKLGCNNNDCRMLLQIHDSIVFEIRKELVDQYINRITDIMITPPEPFRHVTFKVDSHEWGK